MQQNILAAFNKIYSWMTFTSEIKKFKLHQLLYSKYNTSENYIVVLG